MTREELLEHYYSKPGANFLREGEDPPIFTWLWPAIERALKEAYTQGFIDGTGKGADADSSTQG